MNQNFHIRAFYRFVELDDYIQLKEPFLDFCKAHNMKGTILLAREGINATVSATKEDIDKFWNYLDKDARLKDIPFKESYAEAQPFEKMKVRLKKEIVRMGIEDISLNERGTYVKGEDWDKLISDPEVVLVDTRNDYEYLLGTFENAINPKTDEFRSFPKWVDKNLDPKKHKKVAMFCTGGIRCEKSTALLKHKGFENVYHLDGGILQYFEDTKNRNKKWTGSCYVFDDRLAVDAELKPVDVVLCKHCTRPLKIEPVKLNNNQKGISCAEVGLVCGECGDEAELRETKHK
jgi:UPF0176 protein